MLTIALCRDSATAQTQRKRWFDPHMHHLRSIMSNIRFVAPLATADGAALSGDARLVASIFVVETPTLTVARELISSDPYVRSGVWGSVDLFGVTDIYGEWTTTSPRTQRSVRYYSAFGAAKGCHDAARTNDCFVNHRRYMNELTAPALFGGKLTAAGSIGAAMDREAWVSIDFVAADSLSHAKSIIANDSCVMDGSWSARVMAIPLALGSWTGITAPEDIT
jgi:uncharacterized protein YciI